MLAVLCKLFHVSCTCTKQPLMYCTVKFTVFIDKIYLGIFMANVNSVRSCSITSLERYKYRDKTFRPVGMIEIKLINSTETVHRHGYNFINEIFE